MVTFGHLHILAVFNGIMYAIEQMTAHLKLSGYIYPQSRAKGRNLSLIAYFLCSGSFIQLHSLGIGP